MDALTLSLLGKQPFTNLGVRSKIGELADKSPKIQPIVIRKVIASPPEVQQRLREAQTQRKAWWE